MSKRRGYPPERRHKAVPKYGDGGNLRRIARPCGVVHRTVANWVAAAAALPAQPSQPLSPGERAERDALDSFVSVMQWS